MHGINKNDGAPRTKNSSLANGMYSYNRKRLTKHSEEKSPWQDTICDHSKKTSSSRLENYNMKKPGLVKMYC